MPRPRNQIPSYRKHHRSGQAIVTLPDSMGRRKDVYLGSFGSPESKQEYARVIAEWETNGRRLEAERIKEGMSINELILAFSNFAELHYRHSDGSPTSEVANYKDALRSLRELYGMTPAATFGPLALKTIRKRMIDGGKLCRDVINKRIGRIKRVFRWGVSEKLIPSPVFEALRTVDGLQSGRSAAKDRPRVLPVSDEHIQATLPFLNRHIAGMVRVQRLTGMRPGEATSLTRAQIDMSGPVWIYKPAQHKTAHHGKERVIALGERAQAVLKEFFTPAIDDFLFSPIRARAERYITMRAKRQSKVPSSQTNRRKKNPKRKPREKFTAITYPAAVRLACRKAGVTQWHPNQLRHTWGTEIRKRFGLEGAQVGLGHSKANITQVYAEANTELAARIAAEVG